MENGKEVRVHKYFFVLCLLLLVRLSQYDKQKDFLVQRLFLFKGGRIL